jgi:hypothetical protein
MSELSLHETRSGQCHACPRGIAVRHIAGPISGSKYTQVIRIWTRELNNSITLESSECKVAKMRVLSSPCLLVRMQRLENGWTNIYEIWYWWVPIFVDTFQFLLKSDNNNEHFTLRVKCDSLCISRVTSGAKNVIQKLLRKCGFLSWWYHWIYQLI